MGVKPKPAPFTGTLAEPIVHPGMPLVVGIDPAAREAWANTFHDTVLTARFDRRARAIRAA